ncbi:MAG: hypothetical protein LBV45_05470 [Xanthomonadaceae bacterium]|nr:hypothetical protein [Xanthomonadaceae bacterium]
MPHPSAAPKDGELKQLYVLACVQNGWGTRLLVTVLDWLGRDGARILWLGV